MTRSLVSIRTAELTDAPVLTELWADVLRRADPREQLADVELLVKAATGSPEQRVVVAELDGEVAGAIHLLLTTLSTLNLEPAVHAMAPQVSPRFRRRGVGTLLMDAAVTFAEEQGVGHVVTAATASSRDANRFMARLAFAPQAVVRVAPAPVARAKLGVQGPSVAGPGGRQLTRVLAARRSMRRAQRARDR